PAYGSSSSPRCHGPANGRRPGLHQDRRAYFFRVHHEAGLRQLLPRFPRNLNGRAIWSSTAERPRVPAIGSVWLTAFERIALVRCAILRVQCFCYWLEHRGKMNPPEGGRSAGGALIGLGRAPRHLTESC